MKRKMKGDEMGGMAGGDMASYGDAHAKSAKGKRSGRYEGAQGGARTSGRSDGHESRSHTNETSLPDGTDRADWARHS